MIRPFLRPWVPSLPHLRRILTPTDALRETGRPIVGGVSQQNDERPRTRGWAAAVLVALAVPFVITGIGRLFFMAFNLYPPISAVFLLFFTLAVVAFTRRGTLRAIGVGVFIGTAAHAVFLVWLLSIVGRGSLP